MYPIKRSNGLRHMAEATTVETDKKGAASFNGLADGTYYLVETKAPAGYNQLTEAKDVDGNGQHHGCHEAFCYR